MNKAREFDKDDWYGFAGCEAWSEEEQPLIREINDKVLVVADPEGAQLTFLRDYGMGCTNMELAVDMPTQEFARLVLDALPEDLTIQAAERLGFYEIGCG